MKNDVLPLNNSVLNCSSQSHSYAPLVVDKALLHGHQHFVCIDAEMVKRTALKMSGGSALSEMSAYG